MPAIEIRKVGSAGQTGTRIVRLPKPWCEGTGVQNHGRVIMVYGNNVLLLAPESRQEQVLKLVEKFGNAL
jgi:hypothetical protein